MTSKFTRRTFHLWIYASLLSITLGAAPGIAQHRAAPAATDFDTNKVAVVDLRITEADWKVLRYQHREAEFFPEETKAPATNAYSWFPAEAVIDGRNVGRVEIRKKGYIGSNDTRRPALKLRPVPGAKAASESSIPEMTLNNNNQDASLIRQYLAYEIFRRAGVSAPRCSFARVTVNGKSLGIYTRVEPVNEAFLRDRFGRADGTLYEGGRSDFRKGWLENFEVKRPGRGDPRRELEAVAEAIENAKDSLLPVLERHFEADEFFRFWAVESLLNQGDGYAGNCNNFFLYRHPVREKFIFIPWGPDSALYPGRTLNGVKGDPKSVVATSLLPHRLYQSAAGAERYRNTLRQTLANAWNEEILLREVSRLEALLVPALGREAGEFQDNVRQVRDFITKRRADILPELEGVVPELKSKPLPLAKRRNIGRFEGKFSASGSAGDPSQPNDAGQATLSAQLWGKPLVFRSVSVQVSRVGGNAPAEDARFITWTAQTSEADQEYILYLSIDPDSYEMGKPIPIDNTHIFGGCLLRDTKGQSSKMIGMLRGSLLLRSAGPETKAQVLGDLQADVFSKLAAP